jgi:hypothetical protein
MGFVLPERKSALTFEGTDFEGLIVDVRLDGPLSVFVEIQNADNQDDRYEAYRLFAEKILVGWNLEDQDGQLIPANYEGIKQIPIALANRMITNWMQLLWDLPDPLVATSSDGSTSEGAQTEKVIK